MPGTDHPALLFDFDIKNDWMEQIYLHRMKQITDIKDESLVLDVIHKYRNIAIDLWRDANDIRKINDIKWSVAEYRSYLEKIVLNS